jgi:hypothetical protein
MCMRDVLASLRDQVDVPHEHVQELEASFSFLFLFWVFLSQKQDHTMYIFASAICCSSPVYVPHEHVQELEAEARAPDGEGVPPVVLLRRPL